MHKHRLKIAGKPVIILIMTMVLITALLFSSCSVINRPAENQAPGIDPTELPAETTGQPNDSSDTDESVSVDVEVDDYPDDASNDGKAANEDADGGKNADSGKSDATNADIGNKAVEFDAAKDMQLGALKADMPKDEVQTVMKSELVDSTKKTEYGMETETLTYKDGTVINLLGGKIYSMSVKSPDYTTPRGLKTGDTEETLRQLYGEPTAVEDGRWIYSARGYDLFFVTVNDGIVVEMMISQVM